MAVLNRKLFRMHTGGTVPPHAPAGHLHTYDPELSDQELQTQLSTVETQVSDVKSEMGVEEAQETEQEKITSGIMEGFDEDTISQAVTPALELAEKLYPEKEEKDYL